MKLIAAKSAIYRKMYCGKKGIMNLQQNVLLAFSTYILERIMGSAYSEKLVHSKTGNSLKVILFLLMINIGPCLQYCRVINFSTLL